MSNPPGPNQPKLSLPEPGQSGPQLGMMMEPDRRSMHLRIGKDGKLMAGIVLSAEQVDGLMDGLARVRDRMLPEPTAKPAPAQPAAVAPEPVPTEFSAALAQEIKGTHYDFGIDANAQELIFSVRDPALGWLSFRFGARLLERMLKVARVAQKSRSGTPTKQ
jgi:hypothetical protein